MQYQSLIATFDYVRIPSFVEETLQNINWVGVINYEMKALEYYFGDFLRGLEAKTQLNAIGWAYIRSVYGDFPHFGLTNWVDNVSIEEGLMWTNALPSSMVWKFHKGNSVVAL